MPASKLVELRTGEKIPTIGLGTWKAAPGEVEGAVEHALKCGYRAIDTATAYGNETQVGQGIRNSGVSREKIFLTTKLDNLDHLVAADALETSLRDLGTGYLDLWLMHWPAPMTKDYNPRTDVDWLNTWKSMEDLYKKHPEKLKAIGVSNFSIKYLDRLLQEAEIVPAVNQIELHPGCPQKELVDFCTARDIVVTAYSPLGSNDPRLLENKVVKKIAERHNVEPANILISLQANRPGVNVVTKSVTKERIESNLTKVIDLSREEVEELQVHAIDKAQHFRCCHPNWTGFGSLGFPDCE